MLPTDGMVRGMKAIDTGGRSRCQSAEGTLVEYQFIGSLWTHSAVNTPSAIRFIVTRDFRRASTELQSLNRHQGHRSDSPFLRGGKIRLFAVPASARPLSDD